MDEGRIVESIVVETIARNMEDPFRLLWRNHTGFGMLKGKEVDIIIGRPKLFRMEIKHGKVFERKGIDVILTRDELDISKKPFRLPVSFFLLGLG